MKLGCTSALLTQPGVKTLRIQHGEKQEVFFSGSDEALAQVFRGAVHAPSVEMLKVKLDRALTNLA